MIKLVDNIDTGVREYLSNNGLLKKDGSVYKSVTVNNINYTFAGSHYVHNAKNVIHKNNNIIFIKNTINVSKSELDNGLHSFGDAKLVLDGVSYNNSRFTDGQLVTDSGVFSEYNNELNKVFVSWLRSDNSNVAEPLIEKYLYITRVTKNYNLTGYADVESYFSMLKKKSTFSSYAGTVDINNSITFTAKMESESNILLMTNDVKVFKNNRRLYLLFTTYPVSFGKETLPYVASYHKGVSIFVTPFNGINNIDLNKIKGGINLLK